MLFWYFKTQNCIIAATEERNSKKTMLSGKMAKTEVLEVVDHRLKAWEQWAQPEAMLQSKIVYCHFVTTLMFPSFYVSFLFTGKQSVQFMGLLESLGHDF